MGNVAKVQIGPLETNKKTADMIIDTLESRPEIVMNEIAEF